MTVHVLDTEYQTAGEKSHIKNWLNMTVGLRIDKVNQNDDGDTTSIAVTVFTADSVTGLDKDEAPTGESARIESARMIGQISNAGVEVGDLLVVTVVPYGKRGQVLAPPADKDKSAEAIGKAFA